MAPAPPAKPGSGAAFSVGTHRATAAVLAALFQCERADLGQHVEVAMKDAIIPTLTSNFADLVESDGDSGQPGN